jgi:predicted glycosyltransferase involved in capsule biosynthesis
MAKKNNNDWIQNAIQNKGSLRKSLKVKKGQTIPVATLQKASKQSGTLGKRAKLALTLRSFKKGGK